MKRVLLLTLTIFALIFSLASCDFIFGKTPDVSTECDHVWETTTTKPTCESDGCDTMTCKLCNESVITNVKEKLGHNYSTNYWFDEENHWYSCTICKNFKDKSKHELDHTGVCMVCQITPEVHYYSHNGAAYAHIGEKYYGYGTATRIVIASEYNGFPVTTISGGDLNYSNQQTTSVTIPDSVTSISAYAFYSYHNLSSVTIGNSVEFIGKHAFGNCSSLTNVTFKSTDSWWVTQYENDTSGAEISSADLEDPETAAEYLTSDYADYFWHRDESNQDDILPTPGIVYEISDDGTYAEVIGYNGTANEVKIASEYEGLPVKSISYSAFSGNETITSCIIPNSVISIDEEAFSECYSLTSVTLGSSVTDIGIGAFFNCYNLTNISVDDCNGYYKSIDGSLYSKDEKILIQYPGGKTNTSFVIPDSVNSIGFGAFYNCKNLQNVTIPNSVDSIDAITFSDCSSLTDINIPNSVTSIGRSAFGGCSSLTNVTIPDSVEFIGERVFYGCKNLTDVTIGKSVNFMGRSVFEGCSSLANVTFKSTDGWWVTSYENSTSGAGISSADLEDPETAAEYLTSDYADYYWRRS